MRGTSSIPAPPPVPRTVEAILRYGESMRKIAIAKDGELRECEDRRQALVDAINRIAEPLTKP